MGLNPASTALFEQYGQPEPLARLVTCDYHSWPNSSTHQ